jgi:hypothetical protein
MRTIGFPPARHHFSAACLAPASFSTTAHSASVTGWTESREPFRTKTIYLRKRLPLTRRRYILAHELGHAWLDWQHRHLDNGKAKT